MSEFVVKDHAPPRRMILPLRVEDWLALAAAPTFALMALLDAMASVDPAAMICASSGLSPMHGMLPMYLLMSAFHLRPWLRLVRLHRAGERD